MMCNFGDGGKGRSWLTLVVLVVALCSGCERVSTGGDLPLTRDRLESTRLTDIRREVSWTFSGATVVIDNKDQPLPADIVETLKLEPGASYRRVEASWELDEQAGVLRLSRITADDAEIAQPLQLSIAPAGPIRVNLAGRQYNRFAPRR